MCLRRLKIRWCPAIACHFDRLSWMHAHSEVCATEQRLPTKDSPGGSWIVACYRRPWNQGWIGYLYQTNSDRLHRTFHQECPQVNLEGAVWYSCFKLVLLNVDMGSNWKKICGKRAEVLHYVGTNMAAASLEPTFIQVLQVYGQLAEALYEIHVWTSWSSGNELMVDGASGLKGHVFAKGSPACFVKVTFAQASKSSTASTIRIQIYKSKFGISFYKGPFSGATFVFGGVIF